MTDFNLPEDFRTSMKPPTSDDIRLPFNAPLLWWKNGSVALKALGGVQYYGGWAISVEGMTGSLDEEMLPPPPGFVLETWQGDEEYDVYTNRFVYFAPIAYREAWYTADGILIDTKNIQRGTPMPGIKSKLQYLGALATLTGSASNGGRHLEHYGPAVLGVKGLMTKSLRKAFDDFKKATKDLRGETPINAFYVPVGTFGEIVTARFGKGNNQSDVTPVRLVAPSKGYSMEILQSLFVGEKTARKMMDWKLGAAEWLGAFEVALATQRTADFAQTTRGWPASQAGDGPPPPPDDDWMSGLNQTEEEETSDYPF